MAEYLVRYHEPAHGLREANVEAEHPGLIADALGIAADRILSVRAPAAEGRRRRALRARFDLRLFAHELSVLLEAGIPLVEALQTLRERDARGAVLDAVLAAVRDGETFSTALKRQPALFDELFTALVAAGERNGQLVPTLREHAAYLAWSEALKSRLLAAAIYPLMLIGAGWAVVCFLLLYVLPRFAGIFDGLGRELPWMSQALMSWGTAAHAHPVAAIAVAIALPLAVVVAWRSTAARGTLQRALDRSPFIGPRLRLLSLARLYRTLALLLGAGVPTLAALRLAQGVLPPSLRPALQAAAAEVGGGQRLSRALVAHGLATAVASRMLRVGESSGQVAPMLARAAAFHDDEIARFSELVARTVSPALMLAMGVVIGTIVVAMYMPIFTLMEQVQ